LVKIPVDITQLKWEQDPTQFVLPLMLRGDISPGGVMSLAPPDFTFFDESFTSGEIQYRIEDVIADFKIFSGDHYNIRVEAKGSLLTHSIRDQFENGVYQVETYSKRDSKDYGGVTGFVISSMTLFVAWIDT